MNEGSPLLSPAAKMMKVFQLSAQNCFPSFNCLLFSTFHIPHMRSSSQLRELRAQQLSSSLDQTAVKHAENSQTIFIFLPNCFGLLAITVTTAAMSSPGRCQQQGSFILITILYGSIDAQYSEKAL